MQAQLLEAAFDNEQECVQQMITAWVEECFSPLIGAKLDCLDANEHTPLSEAACGGAVEVYAWCAWHVHGMCMACAWHVHGMCRSARCCRGTAPTSIHALVT